MTRPLVALIAAAALALSPATTARAEGGADLIALLLGIGTVYAIGKGIEQSRTPDEPARSSAIPIHSGPTTQVCSVFGNNGNPCSIISVSPLEEPAPTGPIGTISLASAG